MAVTESKIAVSEGAGKNLDTTQVTTAAGIVEREAVFIADPETVAARQKVTNADPGGTDYGSVVRLVGTVPLPTNAATAANQQTNALTDAQLRATAVPVSGTVTASGPLTDTQLRAAAVPVTANAGTDLNTSALALNATTVLTNTKLDTLLAATGAPSVDGAANHTQLKNLEDISATLKKILAAEIARTLKPVVKRNLSTPIHSMLWST